MIRPFQPSDEEFLREIHRKSGVDYIFPDLNSPLFVSKVVIERDGKPTAMLAGRIEAETYLLVTGEPEQKLQDIQELQPAYLQHLWSMGLDTTYCVVPPEIDKHFAKRMNVLGWDKARNWPLWTRPTVIP